MKFTILLIAATAAIRLKQADTTAAATYDDTAAGTANGTADGTAAGVAPYDDKAAAPDCNT
jgi:hypothetical protein